MRNLRKIYYILLVSLLVSCANLGSGPQGGPRDTVPPKIVKELPTNGVLLFSGKKVEITFNEYIQLDDVQKNILISPPQQNPPEVKAIGKTLSLVFQEELLVEKLQNCLNLLEKDAILMKNKIKNANFTDGTKKIIEIILQQKNT